MVRDLIHRLFDRRKQAHPVEVDRRLPRVSRSVAIKRETEAIDRLCVTVSAAKERRGIK